jgi:hypothetical protein
MVPLTEADAAEADAIGKPKSSTQFFAIPQPKRKSKPSPEPAAPPPGPAPGPGAVGVAPPGMAPPGSGSGAPGMGMGMGLGIQGPVSGAPPAMPPQGFPQPAMVPGADPGMDGDRAKSYRVFALVAALMFMVFSALIGTVGMTVFGLYVTSNAQQAASIPAPRPAPKSRGPVVDTGIQAPDPQPAPKARPRPKTGGGPRPAPVGPKPAPAPPPPPANAPGSITITIPGSALFTGIEVTCPDGFRQRGSFVGGKATIPHVPAMKCDLIFKGGLPARNTIRGGETKNCTFNDGIAVCK